MPDSILQPVSRDQIVKLAEGRLGASERRQLVRGLVAQAARNPVPAGLDPFLGEPVPEGSYDLALKRAFETTCRLQEQLASELTPRNPREDFEHLLPAITGQSASGPSASRF